MPVTITSTNQPADPFKCDVKRLYLPVLVTSPCPRCETVRSYDLATDRPLSYPLVGSPFEFWFYCTQCEHEWAEMLLLNITVVSPP